jgi:type II secretory pathway pseudopilin PulG
VVALVSIVAATAASSIAFKIRRDREEELIHRGAEYSRAIRRFTKKMGRYPLRIEDLEATDGLRFLRKRYKDPITGRDFKLLHMTDLQRIGVGGLSAVAVAPPAPKPGSQQPSNVQLNSVGAPGTNDDASSAGPVQLASAQTAGQDDPISPSGSGTNAPGSNSVAQQPNSPSAEFEPVGGVIVGVASISKRETIREFNHKNHYSDWLFFYDPAYDRGFPINGPTQMTMPTPNLAPQQPASTPMQSSSSSSN